MIVHKELLATTMDIIPVSDEPWNHKSDICGQRPGYDEERDTL